MNIRKTKQLHLLATRALAPFALFCVLLLTPASSNACIPTYLPLEDVFDESHTIFIGRVDAVEHEDQDNLVHLIITPGLSLRGSVNTATVNAAVGDTKLVGIAESECQAKFSKKSGIERTVVPGGLYIFLFEAKLGKELNMEKAELLRAERLDKLFTVFFLLREIGVSGAALQDFGEYQARLSTESKNGENWVIRRFKLRSQDRMIQAKKGTVFGFHYKLEGAPEGRSLRLNITSSHPAITTPDGTRFETSAWTQEGKIGKKDNFTGWRFEEEWELVEGTYSLTVNHEGKELIKQEFLVQRTEK